MKRLTKRFRRTTPAASPGKAGSETGPVTEETLEKHRKEIFARGRRFVYPVHITKRHVVRNSLILLAVVVVIFLTVIGLAIYRYKSEAVFVYRISKILPFPAAKVNSSYVSYEEYLFLLKSNQTYLTTQQDNAGDEELLQELRLQAFDEAKRNAVLKQLAQRYGVRVSKDDVNQQIALLESFSGGKKRLDEIVGEFYGISTSELRYLLYIQLLEQKISPLLSIQAKAETEAALARLDRGDDFAVVARELSDDEQTAPSGGSLGVVSSGTAQLPDNVAQAGLALTAGSSEIVAGPIGFHIVKKVADKEAGAAELAHILIRYDDIDALIEQELDQAHIRDFIKL